MSSVSEIEEAISQLPDEDRWKLLSRFEDAMWEKWDHQIEADQKSGKLDALVGEAEAEIYGNKTKSLDELLK